MVAIDMIAEKVDDCSHVRNELQLFRCKLKTVHSLCNADRISTRLIESIPRSASSCMSRSSTPTGLVGDDLDKVVATIQ